MSETSGVAPWRTCNCWQLQLQLLQLQLLLPPGHGPSLQQWLQSQRCQQALPQRAILEYL
jgi:hypothetical protein